VTGKILKLVVTLRNPDVATDAFQLFFHSSLGSWAVADIDDDSVHQRSQGCGACQEARSSSLLACRASETITQKNADPETNSGLGESDNSSDWEIVPEFVDGKLRHKDHCHYPAFKAFSTEMERSIGIDLGEARVGVAISDELGMLAHPLETIKVANTLPENRVAEIVADRKIGNVIVGVAKNMDGSSGPAAEKAKSFISVLSSLVDCPVIAWDERLSTVQARRGMREAGRSEKQQREVIDQAAAAVILQSWLDSRACV